MCLGELKLRLSLGALNTSKAVVLLVDSKFENTPQLIEFLDKLRRAGLSIEIR